MNKKIALPILLIFILGASLSAAQENETPDIEAQDVDELDTGWFTPDSALYGLEVAMDNAAMGIGLSNADNVLEKRSNEARAMAEQGNHEAAERAINSSNSAADRASENATEQAQQTLSEVFENAPEAAQEGLQNAMSNVERVGPPEHAGPGNETGPDQTPPGQEQNETDTPTEGNETDDPQPGNETTEPENGEAENETTEQNQTDVVVQNDGNAFEEDEVTVEQGEETNITFANNGGQHNLVLTDFDDVGTETISEGERESFTHTFEEEGEFTFECTLHEGMEGTIIVE